MSAVAVGLKKKKERRPHRQSRLSSCLSLLFCFFFFQAEDGIRDHCVTGVQTCALPISVGVALPGLFDSDGVALLLPNLYGDWSGRPIRAPLETGLGRGVALVNDEIGRASCRERG